MDRRAELVTGGVVATAAGLDTVLRGARSIPGQPAASAPLESELRFYAAFYVALGLHLLALASDARRSPRAVRAAAGAVWLGGLARATAWRSAGRPTRLQQALLAVELLGPPAFVLRSRA